MAFNMRLGAKVPDFECKTTHGDFSFYDFCDGKVSGTCVPYTLIFSHPKDFTPVCTTEMKSMEENHEEFTKRGCQVLGISLDEVEDHHGWAKDVLKHMKCDTTDLKFPLIADPHRDLVVQLGMLDPAEKNAAGLALPARAVFYVDNSTKTLALFMVYPATTGRNTQEMIRVLDSLNVGRTNPGVATPVNWAVGHPCMVTPALTTDQAKAKYTGFKLEPMESGKEYMRFIDQPQP